MHREDLFHAARVLSVTIDSEVPDEIRDAVLPFIRDEMWLLPTWMHYLHVRYTTPEERSTTMSSTVNETYRHGCLYVHPGWIMSDAPGRRNDVRHEFIHFPLDNIYNAAMQAVQLVDNEQVRANIRERLRLAMEHAVCDLEHAMSAQDRGTTHRDQA